MSGQGLTTATEERALKLLGTGVSAEQVAAALGVTPARISQLLSDESFASQVADLKYSNLLSHSERDNKLDTLEDSLIQKIEMLTPLIMRPMEAIKALQIVNGAKRRGSQGLSAASPVTQVVQIAMPTQIVHKFVTNIQNQVIQTGEQQLLTIQSGTLLKNIQAEQPEVVQSLQESNSPAHAFNSSKGSGDDGGIPERNLAISASGTDLSSSGGSSSQAAGSKQTESRCITPLSFIPVGS